MEVVRSEIGIGLKDEATPELRRIEAEYEAAMARINRMEADARIGAKTEELDVAIKKAKDEVRILKGERATVTIDADAKKLNAEIKKAEAEVKRLDGQKARIDVELRGEREAAAGLERLMAKRAAMAAAEARADKQRTTAAMNASSFARKAEVDTARSRVEADKLTTAWINQSKVVEKLRRQRPPLLGKEAQAEFAHFRQSAEHDLGLVEARLHALGRRTPPLHMRIDDNWLARAKFGIQDFVNNAQKKLSTIGKVRLNIGPFSGTIRTMAIALAGLAPLVTSLGGALTSLVGVMGTGLAGAAAISAGALAGLALNLGGVAAAIHPIISDFKIAHAATQAYTKQVLLHGAGSKQAAKAQDQMNRALGGVDPVAADAAVKMSAVSREWSKLTLAATHQNAGIAMTAGFKTLHAILPTIAKNTNNTTGIIATSFAHMMTSIRKNTAKPGGGILGSLGNSANVFLAPALRGAEHLGAALARIAESAARIFAGPAGNGFLKWAEHFDKSTQNSGKLDAQITRLGHHATDLLHLFGAVGRLLATVFNGGADSGDNMVKSMTRAINRWNDFLKTGRGHTEMADFFKRAEGGARALWGAIGPLIASFVQWSSMLTPFTGGILKGIGFVAHLVAKFTSLLGMKGSLATLGATIGIAFGVSKIAGFLGMIGRIVKLMKEAAGLAKAGKIAEAFKSLGGIGGALRGKGAGIAGSIEGASKTGAATMGTAIEDASVVAARNISTAITEAGGVAGAEQRTAITEGGAIAAEEEAAGAAAGGAAGGGGLLSRLGSGGLLSKFVKGAGAVGIASLLGRQLLGREGDPLAFLFDPASAGGPGDSVSSSPSLKKATDALDKAFGGAKAHKLANDFQMNMDGMLKHVSTTTATIFGKPIKMKAWVDDQAAIQRMDATFEKIRKTAQGKRFMVTLAVKTQGDQLAQERIAKLASTKLGSKLMVILSKGGPEAARWLAYIADQPLGAKLMKIISQGGPGAHKLVQELSNKSIRNKVFNIIQHGGPDAQKKLDKLLGTHIAEKHFGVHAHDFASNILRGVHSLINGLHNKNITVTTTFKQVGRAAGAAASSVLSSLGYARGGQAWAWDGTEESPALRRRQEEAMRTATDRGTQKLQAGKYNRPTLLVGEENRDEYVIATNPAYRKRNVGYLAEAARELGVMIVQPAARGKGGQQHLAPGVGHMSYVRGAPTEPNTRGTRYAQMYSDPFYHEHGASPYRGIKGPGSVYGGIPPIIGDALDAALGKPGQLRAQLAGRFDITTIDAIQTKINDLYNAQHKAIEDAHQAHNDARRRNLAAVKEYNSAKTKSARNTASKHIGQAIEDMRYWYWYEQKAHFGGSVMNRKGRNRRTFQPWLTTLGMKTDVDVAAKQLHTWWDQRAHLTTEASNMQTAADNARMRYEQSGNQVDLDEYDADIAKAHKDFTKVRAMDDEALGIAKSLQQTIKDPKAIQSLIDELTTDQGNADAGALKAGSEQEPGFVGLPAGQVDLNTYLSQQGVFDSSPFTTLAQERNALDTAFAQAGVGDDPAHPDTYADDLRAATDLQTFWQGVYTRLAADPTYAGSTLLGDAATALTSAQGTFRDVNAAANPAVDISTSAGLQTAAANEERGNVLAQFGSNIQGLAGLNPLVDMAGRGMGFAEKNAAMLAPDYGVVGGASGMSTRFAGNSVGAGGGSVHVTNNFGAPPPDPHTWSQGVKFEIGAIL